jgi:hypothetical protein
MIHVTYENVLPGFLLLLLAMMGQVLDSTFSCELHETIKNNIIYKNILLFLLMYFTIYFAERVPEHPGVSIGKAVVLYLFYLIFGKQKPKTLILGLLLLICAFICEQYKDYMEDENDGKLTPQQEKQKKKLELAQIILAGVCVAMAIIGFSIAYREFKSKNTRITMINYLFRNFKCSPNTKLSI